MAKMKNPLMLVKVRTLFLRWLIVFTIISPTVAFASLNFKSPWDRPSASAVAGIEKNCPVAPKVPQNLSAKTYYKDKKGSVIDQARYKETQEKTSSFRQAAREIVKLADQFQVDNDSAAARCAGEWLFSLAQSDALAGTMTGNQAHFVQTWLVNSYATAWLKVRSGYAFDQSQKNAIENWLRKMGRSVMRFHDGRESRANLRYWGGLTAVTVGIAVEDRVLFDWGVNTYRLGIHEIAADGTLPREMERGSRALSYHMFALTPLVMIAELASFNGLDLYGEDNDMLGKLVSKTVSGIRDSSEFSKAAGTKQRVLTKKGTQLIWLRLYARHIKTNKYDDLFEKYPLKYALYLGGECCTY